MAGGSSSANTTVSPLPKHEYIESSSGNQYDNFGIRTKIKISAEIIFFDPWKEKKRKNGRGKKKKKEEKKKKRQTNVKTHAPELSVVNQIVVLSPPQHQY